MDESKRKVIFKDIKEVVLIVTGVFSAGFGLKGFLLPSGFIDGGVTGISLLVTKLTEIPFPILLVLINIPFILLGLSQVGRKFALRSIAAISLLAVVTAFVNYPVITTDKLLVAAFGGFFLGAGIGLSVRGGAVIDGTEVLAIFLSKKTGLTIGDIILIFNILIFTFGAYLLSIEIALYAILTYLSAAKTVDFVIEGVEEYTGITIISEYGSEIKRYIIENLGRGVTIYLGKGGFNSENSEPKEIIYTVITRLEVASLQNEIERIDPSAFITMSSIKDTKGGMIKKRPLRH